MEDAYTLSRKSVDMLTCTAQVVAEHLDHGYVTSEDATRLRAATKEVETEVRLINTCNHQPRNRECCGVTREMK